MINRQVDLLIIGGGSAGLAAAIGAWESGVKSILILEREEKLGGILKQCIHNGFGLHTFNEELTGPEYASRFVKRVQELKIEYMTSTMVLSLSADRVATAAGPDGLVEVKAKAVVLAMGCRERPRGALVMPGTRPAGVYTAGTAQKMVNIMGYMPGKRVVILGSGDIGLIMARRFTLEGAKVEAVVELMPFSSGLQRNISQCLDDFGIPLLFSHTVIDIKGRERLTGVAIAKVDEARRPIPGTEREIECDTLLLSVGLLPETELAADAGVAMDRATRGAVVNENLMTSVDGIFSCGNVLHVHDLVDNVSEESLRAGKCAAEYIKAGAAEKRDYTAVKGENGANGVVPQRLLDPACEQKFMFRPGAVKRGASVVLEADGAELMRRKYQVLTPGEMVEFKVKAGVIPANAGSVALRIEDGENK